MKANNKFILAAWRRKYKADALAKNCADVKHLKLIKTKTVFERCRADTNLLMERLKELEG